MKHFAGVLRPSYYSLVSVTAASERQLRDAEWSYPSGHASFAFATMTVCFLYFVGKTETCKEGPGKAWKLILALFFPGIASMIAISRVVDYVSCCCCPFCTQHGEWMGWGGAIGHFNRSFDSNTSLHFRPFRLFRPFRPFRPFRLFRLTHLALRTQQPHLSHANSYASVGASPIGYQRRGHPRVVHG